MAMIELARLRLRSLVKIGLNSFVFLLGVACITLSATVIPIFVSEYNVLRLAPQVIAGQSFDSKMLESVLPPFPYSAQKCRASVLKATAIVRLRLLESAVALADRKLVSDLQGSLRLSVRNALSCSPTESFLWFLQYWLEVTQNGLNDRALQYLRMSYSLGPNEGWISVKRNGFALAIFNRLPEDLAAQVICEFVSLVRSEFYPEAVANLSGPGWPMREALIAALAPLGEKQRYQFSKSLRAEGFYVEIPGVVVVPRRPWN
jgi:hypothetical protein